LIERLEEKGYLVMVNEDGTEVPKVIVPEFAE
jgi:hypothetical protein